MRLGENRSQSYVCVCTSTDCLALFVGCAFVNNMMTEWTSIHIESSSQVFMAESVRSGFLCSEVK